MTTLTNKCVRHTPNKIAISVIAHNNQDADYFTFCEVCEQNITSFSYYDEDCGIRQTRWVVGK